MNILHILSRIDSYDAIAETIDLSKYLTSNGYNCKIASSLAYQVLESNRLKIENYPLPLFEKNIINFFIAYKKLKEIIRVNNIDIVHTHSILSSWLAFLVCRHTDKLFIANCYDFYTKNIFNYVLILAKKVIIHHEAIGEHLINNFSLPRERIQFIRHGLDLENFHFQGVDNRSKTDFNIGIISSLSSNKGCEYFLKSMVKVVRIIPNIKIWIINLSSQLKQNNKEDLQLWVKRLGLSNYVEFLDASSLDINILSKLNLLIFTPVKENAATRVLLEAQACGVPVVATRVGGVAEAILDNKTGLLVPPKDNDALAAVTIKILKNFQLSREITIAARKRIEEEFSLDKNIRGFIDTYNDAKKHKKILVINIGKAQDVISSIPALRLLRKEISNGQINSLITSRLRCLFQRCPYIDELVIYDHLIKHRGLFGFMDIVKLLIEKRFDIVFDFNNNFKTHLLSYLSLANKRYGYRDRFFRFLINNSIDRPSQSLGLAKDKLAILNLLGIDVKDFGLELWPSQEDMEFADSFLKDSWIGKEKVVGVEISFKKRFFDDFKTLDYLAYLCDRLANEHMRVILIGSSDDFSIKEELLKRMKSKPISAIGDISAIQLASLIKKLNLYISPNQDSLYIAISMKTPSIILSMKKNSFDFTPYKNIEMLTINDFQLDLKKRSKKIHSAQDRYQDIVMEKINRMIQKK